MTGRTHLSFYLICSMLFACSGEAPTLSLQVSEDINTETISVAVDESLTVELFVTEGGTTTKATSSVVKWEVSDASVLTVESMGSSARITGVKTGEITLTVRYDDATLTEELSVIEPSALQLIGPDTVAVGDQFSLEVKVEMSDGSTRERSEDLLLNWKSNTPNARVDENGVVDIISPGAVELSVQSEGLMGTLNLEVPCTYFAPDGEGWTTELDIGVRVAPLEWSTAFNADDGQMRSLSFNDLLCSEEFSWVKTINLITTAGWCIYCPDYLRRVAALSTALKDAGGLVLYVEVQDDQGSLASGEYAYNHINRIIGQSEGLIVGDKNTKPQKGFFNYSRNVDAFPNAFIIRKRDMRVLMTRESTPSFLPFVDLAQDPEQVELMPVE